MRVLFDHQIFTVQRYGGISRYFSRLAQALPSQGVVVDVVAPIHKNQYLNELQQNQVHGYGFKHFPPNTGRIVMLMNQMLSNRIAPRLKPDVLHETYYTLNPVYSKAPVRVLTVYDMIHEKFAEEFGSNDNTKKNKRISVERADHVICISHSTKRDLCEILDVPEQKVSVVHLGFDSFKHHPVSALDMNLSRPFLLYVGLRSGYKNFLQLLRAVATNRLLRETFDIVAFGGGVFSSNEKQAIQELRLSESNVKQVGGGDDVLATLYKNAAAFVYPSLYEGFGLPPLEAMACECPVVTSNTSSMPEIVGNAGEYFDPSSVEDLSRAINAVVFDDQRKSELLARGQDRLGCFSWSRCAAQTLDVYRTVSP